MNRIYLITGAILAFLLFVAFKAKQAIGRINYDYTIKGVKLLKLSLTEPSLAQVSVLINLKNDNKFKIQISNLYYEIYYKGNLLAKSSKESVAKILDIAASSTTSFNQEIEVFVDKTNLQVLKNYVTNMPTDYEIRVVAEIKGVQIRLNKVKITA